MAQKGACTQCGADEGPSRQVVGDTAECITNGTTATRRPRKEAHAEGRNEEGLERREEVIDPFSLPYVMMSDIHYLPTFSCLYFVIEDKQHIVYIGQSCNVRRRWRVHHIKSDLCDLNNLESARRVRIAWLEASDIDSLPQLERAMIRRFRPRLNAVLNGDEKPATTTPLRMFISKGEQRRRQEARQRYMERMKVLTPRAFKSRALALAVRMKWAVADGHEASSYLEEARRIILAQYTLVDKLPDPLPQLERLRPGRKPAEGHQAI
jgi:GIY-YIG catalytic domain